MNTRVLVYGSESSVYSKVCDHLKEAGMAVSEGRARSFSSSGLAKEISGVNPARVVFCAKIWLDPDLSGDDEEACASTFKDLYASRFVFPISLLRICEASEIHFTYVGSADFFRWNETPKSERDMPDFFPSKAYEIAACAEGAINSSPHSLILRLRWPVTKDIDDKGGLIYRVNRASKVSECPNTVSVLPEVLPALATLVKEGIKGLYNLVNPGIISVSDLRLISNPKEVHIVPELDQHLSFAEGETTRHVPIMTKEEARVLLTLRSNVLLTYSNTRHLLLVRSLPLFSMASTAVDKLYLKEGEGERTTWGGGQPARKVRRFTFSAPLRIAIPSDPTYSGVLGGLIPGPPPSEEEEPRGEVEL